MLRARRKKHGDNRMSGRTTFLDTVYDLDTGDGTATHALYRDWAESYDAELLANDYASPGRVAEAMVRQVQDREAPLLDLGCGTGLSGVALREAGFTAIDGTDFSAEMLAVAERKGVYRRLTAGDLSRPIPAAPGEYENITAVGVFSPGHAPAEMIDAVLGLLPPGGCFGFTLNDHAIEEGVYEARAQAAVAEGRAQIAESTYGEHVPGAGLKAKVIVLRRR